jgi:hypothetical protein
MFRVTYIVRTASSGFESTYNKTFETLEQVAEYIQGTWYTTFCEINSYPSEWDDADFGRLMPTREEFSLETIKKISSKKIWLGILFGPYSTYCGLVPNELRLEQIKD